MVQKIVGYDDKGKKVFEREARAYDQSISKTAFGVTLGDIVKAIPIVFLCGIVYANQQNVNKHMMDAVLQVSASTSENSKAINGIWVVLNNLNNYLSASTGKQFKDGVPR